MCALLGRQARVALDHAGLHFDSAANRVYDAAKLNDRAVAGAFDDAASMKGDGRIDEIAAERPKPRCKCGPRRQLRPAGCSQRHLQPGSLRVFVRLSLNGVPPAEI